VFLRKYVCNHIVMIVRFAKNLELTQKVTSNSLFGGPVFGKNAGLFAYVRGYGASGGTQLSFGGSGSMYWGLKLNIRVCL
jgi:hypothetical protein